MKKNPFGISYHKFYIKDKYMVNHWIVHSKMKPIDIDELLDRKVIN